MINPELDIGLLAFFRKRENYDRYISYIDLYSLSLVAQNILKGYEKYFTVHDTVDYCHYHTFVPWFFNNCHADFLSDEQDKYRHIFSFIAELKEEDTKDIVMSIRYRELAKNLLTDMNLIESVDPTKVTKIPIFDSIKMEEQLSTFNQNMFKDNIDYTNNSIKLVRTSEINETIFTWRLQGLQNGIGGLKPQKFVLFAAYQNKGKTAFAASETVNIATQLPPNKNVLYFNNEEANEKIIERLYVSALNLNPKRPINISDIDKNLDKAEQRYVEIMGGDINKIKVFDIRELKDYKCRRFIEAQCKKHNAGFIVIDQPDNILSAKTEENKRPYRDLYQWCRNLACKYAPVLGLSQVKNPKMRRKDGSETIKEWIDESDLHWSSTDKQGTSDLLITMGFSATIDNLRNFWVHRNKGGREGVKFSALLCQEYMHFK